MFEQFGDAAVLRGAGRKNWLDTEAVKAIEVVAASPVDFVDDEIYGLFAFQGDSGDFAVFFAHWYIRFDNDPDDIGAVDGLDDLFLDGEFEVVFGGFHPGGIDEPEIMPVVSGLCDDAVAGGARLGSDDGLTAFEYSIKQATFAHIGTPDYRHDWQFFTHCDNYNRCDSV